MNISRTIRGKVGKAIGSFNMISEGDKILIYFLKGKIILDFLK